MKITYTTEQAIDIIMEKLKTLEDRVEELESWHSWEGETHEVESDVDDMG